MSLFETSVKSVVIGVIGFVVVDLFNRHLDYVEQEKQKLSCEVYGKQSPFGSVYNEAGCFVRMKIDGDDSYLVTRKAHEEIVKDFVKMSIVMGSK